MGVICATGELEINRGRSEMLDELGKGGVSWIDKSGYRNALKGSCPNLL